MILQHILRCDAARLECVYIRSANEFSWHNKLQFVISQSHFISDDDDDDAVVTLEMYVLEEPDSNIVFCFIDTFKGDFRMRRLCSVECC
jgi:hypothetical protein